MKPIIILPPDVMSEDGIKALRENDLCVVVATDPSKVKFIDPIPAQSSRTQMEDAAIQLSRRVLNGQFGGKDYLTKSEFASLYVELLVSGTPLGPGMTQEESDDCEYQLEKTKELRRLAREDAKKEHAKQKTDSKTK